MSDVTQGPILVSRVMCQCLSILCVCVRERERVRVREGVLFVITDQHRPLTANMENSQTPSFQATRWDLFSVVFKIYFNP